MQLDDKDAELDAVAATAMNAMRHAADLRHTFFTPPNIELGRNQNFTATGTPGETVVLKLGNFVLSGNSTFTLEGTAGTTFIINVDKKFSLAGNASIVLGSDVQWGNVLFNICGKNGAVSLAGSSRFAGILMANRRTIHITNSANVTGEVIANRVMLSSKTFNGDANVGNPSVVSQ
jgi:choice-of-anchor A domain-containing protein